jgi:hypothetical protein
LRDPQKQIPIICRTIDEPDVTFFHGFTYNGHPVSCAAALKNLEILLGVGLVENAARSDEHPQRRVQELPDLSRVGNVRAVGLSRIQPGTTRRALCPPVGSRSLSCQNLEGGTHG